MKAALHAFRRAMRSTTREDAIVHFWSACEVVAAAGDRKPRDAEAAQVMKTIFKKMWYEFPDQIDGFLNLRNKILHEAASEVQWHHVYFSQFLFERLFGLLLWYSHKKKKRLAQIRAMQPNLNYQFRQFSWWRTNSQH
jgi:hypothetical protein